MIRNLTDSFICCYEKEMSKETKKDIGSMDDIPSLMADVTFAGSDTTSSSLTWFLLYMVLYPDIQEKVQREINFVVNNDRLPNWKDARNMPYLQATLCEVVRASGISGVGGTNVIREVKIADYHIPEGTFVAINLCKLHHDERDWPEPGLKDFLILMKNLSVGANLMDSFRLVWAIENVLVNHWPR